MEFYYKKLLFCLKKLKKVFHDADKIIQTIRRDSKYISMVEYSVIEHLLITQDIFEHSILD